MPVFTLAAFLVLTGFYSLYTVSRRTECCGNLSIESRLEQHQMLTRITGAWLLLFGLAVLIISEGTAAGVFTYFILLMTTASLVILLVPLRLLSVGSFLTIYGLMAFVEIILF